MNIHAVRKQKSYLRHYPRIFAKYLAQFVYGLLSIFAEYPLVATAWYCFTAYDGIDQNFVTFLLYSNVC